ncbi:MAG: ABC transporter permease [Nocardioides sp.]|uniref:ABC transporter permease n=1 Tax=Nocardioides sp. TaxID=35761 RepID=UPI003F0A4CA3
METEQTPIAEKYPPAPPESPAARKGRLAALFVMPFLMVTMMYATYMGTMHDPQPRDLPVAVAGPGAGDVATQLEASTDGALDVRVVEADEARELVTDREVAGAVVLGENQSATVLTASAAGVSQSSLVSTKVLPTLAGNGWQTATEDLVPVTDGDGSGTLVLFAAMGMVLAGYVPLSGMIQATPNLLRLRRFVPIAVGWAAAVSTIIWTILGPIVGAVEGHYLAFLGTGTLTILAVSTCQLLFSKVMGAMGVLPGMLIFVIFGVPSSGLAMPTASMPGFFQWLHGVLPLGQAGEALRAFIYFEDSQAVQHLLVIAGWLVVSLLLCALRERKGHEIVGGPLYHDREAPLPALAGGPAAHYKLRLVAVTAFPLAIVATVVTLMGFSMHQPTVRDMPVAVVGPAVATEQFVAGLAEQTDGILTFTEVEDREEATELVRTQEVVAAYVLPTEQGGEATLVTAGGAGAAQKNVVTQVFTPVAAASQTPLVIDDIAPLTENDTNSSNSLYTGMSWIMAGFLFFAVLRGGAPEITRTRQLLPMVAGWSVGISVWLWFLFDVLIGAVNGHALEMIGVGAVTVFCVAWFSALLVRPIGLMALLPVMVIAMLAGVPASGGGLSVYMVPEIFRDLTAYLPLPAAVDIARSMVYFGNEGLGHNLLVLAVWGAVGLLLNVLVVDPWLNRSNARPPANVPRAGGSPRGGEGEVVEGEVVDPASGDDLTPEPVGAS